MTLCACCAPLMQQCQRVKAFVEIFDKAAAVMFGETEELKNLGNNDYSNLQGCIVAVVDDNRINLAVAKRILQT